MNFLKIFFVIIFALPSSASAKPVVRGLDKTNDQLIDQYVSVLKDFNSMSCQRKDRRRFEKYINGYKNHGYYVPFNDDGNWNLSLVRSALPLLEEKHQWIKRQKRNIPKDIDRTQQINALSKEIDQLLVLKQKHRLAKTEDKAKIKSESRVALIQFKRNLKDFFASIPFLLSFKYPVDHLENRKIYNKAYVAKKTGEKNRLLFNRKIIEDGTSDSDLSNRDLYLRSTIDTVVVRLDKSGSDFLLNEIRYDLEWVLSGIRLNLKRGSKQQWRRMDFWEKRISSQLKFYRELLNTKTKTGLKKGLSIATYDLRDFVYKKHVATYKYFTKQPEIIQALFALDQILLNEVGPATADNYRDRQDITQIVINRRFHREYSTISKDEEMYKKTGNIKTRSYPWLNVLFKRGEFSFTYYFMPAVVFTFCPDFYGPAKEIRRKNLHLALELLRKPRKDFDALRYFSRVSMLGRIDMTTIWDKGHTPLPQQPGRIQKSDSKLKKQIADGNFRYLDQFVTAEGVLMDVLEIGNDTYSVSGFPDKPKFYNYRDPNLFSYFKEDE